MDRGTLLNWMLKIQNGRRSGEDRIARAGNGNAFRLVELWLPSLHQGSASEGGPTTAYDCLTIARDKERIVLANKKRILIPVSTCLIADKTFEEHRLMEKAAATFLGVNYGRENGCGIAVGG